MHVKELLELERRDIRALHYTWIAFFLTFYVWFNIAPLATSMVETAPYITAEDIKLFLIANVALTIPGRVFIGMVLDHFGPRRTFSILLVTMAVPTWFFAFGDSNTQLFIARLFMSLVGCGFVIGIHMTALWFKPKDIGFAEGFYAGWGQFRLGSGGDYHPDGRVSVFRRRGWLALGDCHVRPGHGGLWCLLLVRHYRRPDAGHAEKGAQDGGAGGFHLA